MYNFVIFLSFRRPYQTLVHYEDEALAERQASNHILCYYAKKGIFNVTLK